MQLELEFQRAGGPVLLAASSPEAAWQGGIVGWLQRVAAEAWQSERPTVVAVPTRGQAQALKARALEAGLSFLGLQFLTPPYLRALLAHDAETPVPPRPDLRLLLALAAEETLEQKSLTEPEKLAAISVRRTPDHLLSLLERLSAAGIDFDQIDLAAFRPVVRAFRAQRAAAHFALPPEADRAAFDLAKSTAPVIGSLLLTGFHGAHWPLWHLLRAAVQSSASATVLLQNPREQAEDLDAAWVGSWEQAFGEAQPIAASDDSPTAPPAALFLAGLDSREQADAIVAATHQFLAHPNCTRLGILFPAAGALSRLVASALTRQGVPHYDTMGQMVPGIFETPVFQNWLELQRTPRLHALLRFLHALEADHPLFENISRRAMADALHKALGALAIDDLTILLASARGRDAKGELLSTALAQILFLPERATFAEFIGATHEAFVRLGWEERAREIEHAAIGTADLPAAFSRTLFLRWLEEITPSFRVTRDAGGSHPYARVQLLTPAQAEDQTWSHLIFAGLNESVWPAAPAGDFLPAAQIESLNQSVRQINRKATRRGRQGEGHVAVQDGRALFLGGTQQRQLVEAQFASLCENTRYGLAFTASVVQEETPERISNPSEFLNRAFHSAHGRALSQQDMRALRENTQRWLREANLEPPNESPPTPAIQQTLVAYQARRSEGAAGEYDFALRIPPAEIAPLSVSQVEEMLKAPALVWLRRYLGVEGEEDATYAWQATVGKWTHEWLASVSAQREGFARFPSPEDIAQRIQAAAERKRAEVQQLCRQARHQLPDWWESEWEGALCLAQTLGRILSGAEDWGWLAPEWHLEAQAIDLGEGRQLLLRGRADLLLSKVTPPPDSLTVPELWIVDFKTGNKEALTKGLGRGDNREEKIVRKVLKGDALQLGLYAVAAHQLGAQDVAISLLSPINPAAQPELTLEDLEVCRPAFRELARMQATGVFGFRGQLRGAFTFTKPYPLATLAVDPEIVDERWEETHPDLVVESNYSR